MRSLVSLAGALLALSSACSERAAKPAERAVVAEAKRRAAPARTPVELATAWIDAVRVRDLKAIAALTAYPFSFRDTGSTVSCEGLSATAVSEAQLATALRCPFEDSLQHEALVAHPILQVVETAAKDLLPWTKRYAKEIAPGYTAVVIDVPDNGVFFQFVLLVEADRVRTVLLTAEFDPN